MSDTPPIDLTSDEDDAASQLLAELADDFSRRYRCGERPSVEEYAQKHPTLAGEIRELFPAMLLMEQQPGLDPTLAGTPVAERAGATIGRYKLLERIGEGGFGVVFMAEQQHPIRRKVALKVIKAGMDTGQVIARFEAERQALTMMDHPNIAKVLDAGATDTGRPYFVMELVKGIPITDYCDQARLTTRERLELMIPVCNAVQHAHTKGVIHRDLKPTNVLVTMHDDKPVPKVIDFGIAKATGQQLTEKTLFTNYAQLLGTPLYMSPEQAQLSGLDVDTRSDVYSLGVLLYELLTGTTPFEKQRLREAAHDEMRRIIREEEPPKPSTRLSTMGDAIASVSALRHTEPKKLSQTVRGELDWIVMKALEKDRSRRYETANGFAIDVQRYLADEAVHACPPSVGYRFRKFARRNRTALAFTGLVLLILLTVTGGIGWNVRDRAARQTAVEQEAKLALKEAEESQEQGKWPEALSAAKRAGGLLAGGGSDEVRERVHQLRKDLEMVLRLEDIRLLSSEWKDDKFDHETAGRAYAQAFAEYGIDVAELPVDEAAARIRERPRVAIALAAALDDWWAFSRSGQKLTALAQSADPDPWRRQVREAHKQNDDKALAALAASPELLRQPPTSLLLLAWAMRSRRDVQSAIEVLRQAQRQYPGDFWINFELAYTLDKPRSSYRDEAVSFLRAALAVRPQSIVVLNNLGRALYDQGKVDEAIACYRRAIELDPRFVMAHVNLGNALRELRKFDEAIACYHKAIDIDPKSAWAHSKLGLALRAQGKLDEAIAAYRTAIELDPKSAWTHSKLGLALKQQGKLDEAIACYRKAIELDPNAANAYDNLGSALYAQKKLDEAIAAFRKAIDLDPKSAIAHLNLGNGLKAQGKLDAAIAAYSTAIELDPKYVNAHRGLGLVLQAQGKLDEAMACYQKAIDLDPKSASAYDNLGSALYDQKKLDEAIAAFRKAIELDPKSASTHIALGNVLKDRKKMDEAIGEYRKAVDLNPKYALAHYNLGNALADQKKLPEAIDAYHKAIEINPKYARAYDGLGTALRDQQKLPEAIDAYHKAIEINPKYAMAYDGLGTALRDQQKLPEAIDVYREAIGLDPKYAIAHGNLGAALIVQDQVDAGIAEFREAIKLDPKYAVAHYNLGCELSRKGLRDDAIEEFRETIRLKPDFAEAHYGLAFALRGKELLDDAITEYREAIRLNKNHAAAHGDLGTALLDQNKLDEAVAHLRTAIKLDPKNASAHSMLGKALVSQNKLDDAIASYLTAIALDPKSANTHYGLGYARVRQAKDDDAIAAYRQAIALDPKFAIAYHGLGNALMRKGKNDDDAIAALRKAIQLDPKNVNAQMSLGYALCHLADHPDPKLRDPKRAVEISKEAVELAPQSAGAWQVLGWVQYRAGNWTASIEALEKSCKLQEGGTGNAFQWLLLAMAHGQLGHKEQARQWYDKAIEFEKVWREPLRGFREEAEKVLGVNEKK